MRYTSALVLAVASLAAAQSSTSTAATSTTTQSQGSGECNEQTNLIISSCLDTTQPQVEACSPNDWDCLCSASEQVDTCYNNCPSHPDAFGQLQTTTSYCNAAKAYGSSSSVTSGPTGTASAATGAATAATSTSSESASVQTGFASNDDGSDSSNSDNGDSSEGNAASRYAPAGGLIAAIFAFALI